MSPRSSGQFLLDPHVAHQGGFSDVHINLRFVSSRQAVNASVGSVRAVVGYIIPCAQTSTVGQYLSLPLRLLPRIVKPFVIPAFLNPTIFPRTCPATVATGTCEGLPATSKYCCHFPGRQARICAAPWRCPLSHHNFDQESDGDIYLVS